MTSCVIFICIEIYPVAAKQRRMKCSANSNISQWHVNNFKSYWFLHLVTCCHIHLRKKLRDHLKLYSESAFREVLWPFQSGVC